jgi:hypothetical protein
MVGEVGERNANFMAGYSSNVSDQQPPWLPQANAQALNGTNILN